MLADMAIDMASARHLMGMPVLHWTASPHVKLKRERGPFMSVFHFVFIWFFISFSSRVAWLVDKGWPPAYCAHEFGEGRMEEVS